MNFLFSLSFKGTNQTLLISECKSICMCCVGSVRFDIEKLQNVVFMFCLCAGTTLIAADVIECESASSSAVEREVVRAGESGHSDCQRRHGRRQGNHSPAAAGAALPHRTSSCTLHTPHIHLFPTTWSSS